MLAIQQIPFVNMTTERDLTLVTDNSSEQYSLPESDRSTEIGFNGDQCVIDPNTVYFFKHLIRKYKKKMGDIDDSRVSSGGLQHYLIKDSEKKEKLLRERTSSGQEQSKFECLPVDVKLHIFSYLTATNLCRGSRVCRSWYDITEENLLWQGLLDRDIHNWQVIGHNTNPAIYKEVDSEWLNKQIYLRCSPDINRMMHEQNTMFTSISSMLRYFLPKKTPTFAMFGPGLETQTSKLVRRMMNDPLFQSVGLVPGRYGGVGGGFIMKAGSSQFNLSIMYSASKQERERSNRNRDDANKLLKENTDSNNSDKYELIPHVQDFCRIVDGFVYVVDATADSPAVESGLNELTAMVSERWSALHVPVLVLSTVCHPSTPRLPCCDVVTRLQLSNLTRPWQVRNCSTETLAGVVEGFTWLAEQTQRR